MNLKKLAAAVTAILCSASTLAYFPELVQQVSAAEAVANDFEVTYEGWYGKGDSVELQAVNGVGVGGSRGMVVTGRKSKEDGAASSKGFYLIGGVAYTYNVQVMSISDQVYHVSVLTKDEETDAVTEQEIITKAVKGGEWTNLSAVYEAPENSYEFCISITTDSTDNFAFDDVRITSEKPVDTASAAANEKGLKDAYANYFRVGNILNGYTVKNSTITATFLKDYNAIECENETKPDATMVQNGSTDNNVKVSLNSCAAICDFAVKNNLAFRGHTLVWHSQMPEWFFKQGFNKNNNWVDKNTMNTRMESYIKNMFNAYQTQYPTLNLYAYDVCNECVSDDASRTSGAGGARVPGWGNGASPWVQIYGNNSFVEQAFTYARKYAPKTCKLYYNDYNEYWDHKRDCIYNMCKSLYGKGLLDGVGMQSHINADSNGFSGTSNYVTAMKKYLSIGCDVQITELDISTENSKFSADQQAKKYKEIFGAAVDWNKNPQGPGRVTLVQIWGPNDANTWIKTENAPLLYNTNNQPKAAYNALMQMIPQSDWGDYKNPANGGGTPVETQPPTTDPNGYWFHQTFESGTEGYESRGGTTVESSSTNKYAGSKAMYVSGRTDSWNGANFSLPYGKFKAGEEYSFSAEVMYDEGVNDAEDIYFSIQYTDSTGETVYAKIDTGTVAKGKWMQLANTNYKIPSDASDVVIYFETPDTTTSFYVDEVIAAPAGTQIEGSGKPKAPNSKQTYLKGDVDGDGVMDVYDLGLAKKGIVKGFDNKVAERCADIDENGTVEVKDIIQMGKFLLGTIKQFEVVEKVGPKPIDLSSDFSNYKANGSWKYDGENNPLTTQRFGADPGWMVYKDRLYIYTTNDAFEYYTDGRLQINTYNSGTINCISSADLVNWTDHGPLPIAAKNGRTQGGCAKWASNAWAPDAEWKTIDGKDKFFLYFANNGSGVGVCVADSPTGPFRDELGHEIANSSVPGGQGVVWQFDPGVYLDRTTGEAYLAYGGGVPSGKEKMPGTGRIGKLSDDMQHIEGSLQAMQTPCLFEDSSLIKIGDTWYYSYCSNWSGGDTVNGIKFGSADICYMTSKNPLKWDSSNFAGMVFANTGSQRIDNGGNNHHSIIYFKGKYYVAYHSRQQALRMGITAIDRAHPNDRSKDSKDGNYRSTQLNECSFNNGKLSCNGDMKGITKQLENLNPYTTVGAETMSNQSKGISIQGLGDTQVVAKANEWTKVSGVEFTGTQLVRVKASSNNGATIRMSTGKVDGPVLAYIKVPAGGQMDEIEAGVFQNLNGVEDVYFSYSGDVVFDSWEVE